MGYAAAHMRKLHWQQEQLNFQEQISAHVYDVYGPGKTRAGFLFHYLVKFWPSGGVVRMNYSRDRERLTDHSQYTCICAIIACVLL